MNKRLLCILASGCIAAFILVIYCPLYAFALQSSGNKGQMNASGSNKIREMGIVTFHNCTDAYMMDYFRRKPSCIPIRIMGKVHLNNYEDYYGDEEKEYGSVDGVQIFRKDLTGKETRFKKVATVRRHGDAGFYYLDRKVKASHVYLYKVRPYVKVKGRKKYGKYTSSVKEKAAFAVPKLKLGIVKAYKKSNGKLTVKIKSNKNNNLITYKKNAFRFAPGCHLKILKKSSDGRRWSAPGKIITLKPGRTLFLKLKVPDSKRGMINRKHVNSLKSSIRTYGSLNGWDYGLYMITTYKLGSKKLTTVFTGEFDD